MSGAAAIPAVGMATSWLGGNQAATGAARTAEAAEREARAARGMILEEGRRGEQTANKYAQASPQELAAFKGALKTAQTQNAQTLKLMDSIDPALMEASSQILKLIRGETSSMGGAFESSRAAQRKTLVDSLRAQYGPGAESSAIGQKALQNFDMTSTTGSIGMNTSTLGALSQFLTQRPDATNSVQQLGQAGQNFGNISQRRATTALQGNSNLLQALSGANQNVIDRAGSGHVYQTLAGQNLQRTGNQMYDYGMQQQQQATTMAAAFMGSDRRLKQDITQLTDSIYRDVPTYTFRYKDPEKYGHGLQTGVMAQDLIAQNPDHPAVEIDEDGFYMVDYSKVEVLQ